MCCLQLLFVLILIYYPQIGDISSWNVSQAVDLYSMLQYASSFNVDIGKWQTNNVKSLWNTFQNASSFNIELPWNTSNVEDFENCFHGATIYNQPLKSWTTSKAVIMTSMVGLTTTGCVMTQGYQNHLILLSFSCSRLANIVPRCDCL